MTLIELLIVVAIIAILAAIAVPNFLEAQVRSKVSRVKADFRSLATAIEAYAVDNNGHYNFTIASGSNNATFQSWLRWRSNRLTTPVAYFTSLPSDPFVPAAMQGWVIPTELDQNVSSVYMWYDEANAQMPTSTQQYMNIMKDIDENVSNPNHNGFRLACGRLHQRQWFLISQGPAQILATNGVTPTRLIVSNTGNANGGYWYVGPYDATNGTVSKGFIVQHN
ncbi:MAG: prepilin-type N-terminal cleavage/methylation domain-containing protein [Candidatus Sumerlaeaceae bacterium]